MKNLKLLLIAAVCVLTGTIKTNAQCDPGDTVMVTLGDTIMDIAPKALNNVVHFYKTASDSDRVIFLMPGLGGDQNAWQDVHDETDGVTNEDPLYAARKAEVVKFGEPNGPGYTEAAGLAAAGGDIYDDMVIQNLAFSPPNRENNIAIGHSQGGLALRATDYYMRNTSGKNPQFGGLVTFGSAHQGAEILTNGLPASMGGQGMIGDMANEMCDDLLAGPLSEAIYGSNAFYAKLVRLLNIDDDILDAKTAFCDFVTGDSVLSVVAASVTPNITTDYMAHNENYSGSNYLLNTLNSYAPNIPMVAFYGEEEEPVFWRQMGSLRKGVYTYNAFQADPDQQHVDDANDMRINYYTKYLIYKGHAEWQQNQIDKIANMWHYFFNPVSTIIQLNIHTSKRTRYLKVMGDYHVGYDFLKNTNKQWKAIIGAYKTNVQQNGYICECEELNGGNGVSINWVATAAECPPGVTYLPGGIKRICLRYPNIETVVTHKPSDGIVLAESAKNLPGATVNPALSDDDYKLENTNHQQLRNSSETREKLNRLFDYNDYSNFFITKPR
ncbi:hypothetical protein Oweho_1978 [Owenweeksia hongkongensis DSM 17368]|uniref:Uncharacterized protein n=1 Tax=Owenweeksia hongkongensis (strain DSM 17368 / CIP 108786 / JCM 12287 / NRRL B-23963 / UST20020801) TaxID=926562 RepID=G8R2W3_OWEHD|nr:alpha/beta hydrolase [Owenweeksia hongkongensis]AEV32957.1 hypothetical protein Oweho_1978 [Owenweeksia hongkongensis DSM 17368]